MSSSEKQLDFVSFSWKRLIAALLFLAVALFNIIILGIAQGRHIPGGSIMTFEGPSYFYTSGLVPTIVAIGLFVYCALSYFKGSIKTDENSFEFTEKRPRNKVYETKFEKENILRMELSNNTIAIKYIWLLLFVPYLIINYYYMILNFNQPLIANILVNPALTILISIILSLASLIILFGFPQWHLTIYTDRGKYELWFEPYKNGREMIEKIANHLEIVTGNEEELVNVNPFKNLSLRNIVIAAFFLGYGLFNILSFMTTLAIFQTIVVYPLIIMSSYMISRELRKLPLPETNEVKENLRYNLKSKYYQKFLYLKKYDEIKVNPVHDDFEVFWGICTGMIFIVIPFKLIQIWMVLNESNLSLMIDNALIMTLFGMIIMLLLGFVVLGLDEKLVIKSNEINIINPVDRSNLRKPSSLKEIIKSTASRFRLNFSEQDLKKQFIRRLIFISIAVVLAVLLILWQYFFYFNLFNIFNI